MKTVYDIGYVGEGQYKPVENKRETIQYYYWRRMLLRCSHKYAQHENVYADCTICEEWKNFQVFAKWFDKNYYQVNNEQMHLDKDLLIKGNKEYSPHTCIFVPQTLNKMITNKKNARGEYPLGCTYHEGKIQVTISINKKLIYLGRFNDIKTAFNTYKQAKEQLIKDRAEEYKPYIPHKLYDALVNFTISIDD